VIRFENVTHFVGERTLFQGLCWHVRPQCRIGLVGDNGSGKTTLLRMATGELEPADGKVSRRNRIRVGFLRQEFTPSEQVGTVLGLVLQAWEAEQQAAAELRSLYEQLGELSGETQACTLERIHELQSIVRHKDLSEIEAEAKKVLAGLGFRQADFQRPLAEFSGGWQMRAALARLLIERHDVLLLDEPTNHLDLESTQWLVEFLTSYSGTLVVVSHDHYFLDTVVGEIAWLSVGKIRTYAGNYSAFLRAREQEEAQLLRAYENQQRELARAERFIERFRYKATKASAVQSRIKQLEKMERIELPPTVSHVRLRLPEPLPSAKTVLELRNVSKQYSGQTILRDISLRFDAGDKVALVGRNGSGKSTLLRICAGIELCEGLRVVPAKTEIAFFAQSHAEALDLEATVLEVGSSWAANMTEEQLRTFLGAFLFSGDDVFKPVRVLSGGEKTRLALARVLLKPANVLLLDEPTNHLDIATRKILLEALKEYAGTVVFVSHDRYFLEQLATKIVSLDGSKATLFYTTYQGFLEKQRQESERPELKENAVRGHARNESAASKDRKAEGQRQNPLVLERKLRTQRRVEIKTRLDALQREIESLEIRLREIESIQANPEAYSNGLVTPELCAEADSIRQRLPELIQQWEKLVDEYEAIRRSAV